MKIKQFGELAPVQGNSLDLGWYIGSAGAFNDPKNMTYYYLHDDGNLYDYCWNENIPATTGWFETKEIAIAAAVKYYTKYGLVYPYGRPVNQQIKSKTMKFKI